MCGIGSGTLCGSCTLLLGCGDAAGTGGWDDDGAIACCGGGAVGAAGIGVFAAVWAAAALPVALGAGERAVVDAAAVACARS